MTTTAVFAEILAIGIQAAILVCVAGATFLDLGPALSVAEGWEALITVAMIGIAYVLGVVIDRLADSALTPLRKGVSAHEPAARAELRKRILSVASPLSTFLEYQRSRMRLMRGTVLNLVLALPIINAFLMWGDVEAGPALFLVANGLLVVLLAACCFAFVAIIRAHDKWLGVVESSPPDRQPGATRR